MSNSYHKPTSPEILLWVHPTLEMQTSLYTTLTLKVGPGVKSKQWQSELPENQTRTKTGSVIKKNIVFLFWFPLKVFRSQKLSGFMWVARVTGRM